MTDMREKLKAKLGDIAKQRLRNVSGLPLIAATKAGASIVPISDAVLDGKGVVTLGIEAERIVLRLDEAEVTMTADQADEMAADLRSFAIELRNGGRVA